MSSYLHSATAWIASYFEFDANHTTFTREIRGGVVTFLTMSYILLVNPMVVTDWMGGDNPNLFPEERTALVDNIATATALVCSVGTMGMGVVTNLPFAVGPGMSMNSVFAGSIPMAMNQTQFATSQHQWKIAVTSSLFGGLVVFFLGAAGLGPRILKMLPDVLKAAIRVGIGLFQCFLALRVLHIIQSEPTELLKFVDAFDFSNKGEDGPVAQILFAVTLMLISSLYVIGVHSPILIAIILTTIVCWIGGVGGVKVPSVPFEVPTLEKVLWNYDADSYFKDASAMGITISYAIITLFDVGGAMFAVMTVLHQSSELSTRDSATVETRVISAEDDHADGIDGTEVDGLIGIVSDDSLDALVQRKARRVYTVVGLTSMLSSVVGCSPTVVFLECLAGAASGSRTGFSSVVTSLLFLVSMPLGPVFRNVPACGAVPALVLIGCFMMSSAGDVPWHSMKKAFPAFVTIMMMPFTASITPGIIGGVVSYVILEGVDRAGKTWKQWKSGHAPHGHNRRQRRTPRSDDDQGVLVA